MLIDIVWILGLLLESLILAYLGFLYSIRVERKTFAREQRFYKKNSFLDELYGTKISS